MSRKIRTGYSEAQRVVELTDDELKSVEASKLLAAHTVEKDSSTMMSFAYQALKNRHSEAAAYVK